MAVETKEYRAEARFQRVSPQKARLVLDLIKGRGVEEALATAAFTKKRIAPVIHKLLTSAVDNASMWPASGASIWTWTISTSSWPWPTKDRA